MKKERQPGIHLDLTLPGDRLEGGREGGEGAERSLASLLPGNVCYWFKGRCGVYHS